MIEVKSKRHKIIGIQDCIVIDVTSKSKSKFIQFSPFYPHSCIPVPYSDGIFSNSVEGIWQGLKYIEGFGIDQSKFHIENMKNIKRKGKVIGHQKGLFSSELLNYLDARLNIYIPTYNWLLETKLKSMTEEIYNLNKRNNVILLDYNNNQDIYNFNRPLSHASLIKKYIEDFYA